VLVFEPPREGYGRIRRGTEQDGEDDLRNVTAPVQGGTEYRLLPYLHFSTLKKRLKQTERILAHHKWHRQYKYGSVSDNMKTLSYQIKLSGEGLETKGSVFSTQHIYNVKFTI